MRKAVNSMKFQIRFLKVSFTFCLSALFAIGVIAESKTNPDKPPGKRKKWAPQGELDQDFPFTTACIGAPFPGPKNDANKGIAIKLDNNAYVCFDTDLLRMAFGWTGKYLNLQGVAFDGMH